METTQTAAPWSARPEGAAATIDHIHRLCQVAGKYTLDQVYEPNWGNIGLSITGRGFCTPTVRRGDAVFRVDYDLIDDVVTIASSTGIAKVPLGPGSVSDFYTKFVAACESIDLPPPGSTIETEIEGASRFPDDTEQRRYDVATARWIARAFADANSALVDWQAPYRGHRPGIGIMWGGFDLAATRYDGRRISPPDSMPMFQQNGMTEQVVALGFALGDDTTPAYFYAYISPSPAGFETTDFSASGASYLPEMGLASLPWDVVVDSADPLSAVVSFGDAVWGAAVAFGGWDAEMQIERHDGWHAGKNPRNA